MWLNVFSLKLYQSMFFNHLSSSSVHFSLFFIISSCSSLQLLQIFLMVAFTRTVVISHILSFLLILFYNQCLLHFFIRFTSSFSSTLHLFHLFVILEVRHKKVLFQTSNGLLFEPGMIFIIFFIPNSDHLLQQVCALHIFIFFNSTSSY